MDALRKKQIDDLSKFADGVRTQEGYERLQSLLKHRNYGLSKQDKEMILARVYIPIVKSVPATAKEIVKAQKEAPKVFNRSQEILRLIKEAEKKGLHISMPRAAELLDERLEELRVAAVQREAAEKVSDGHIVDTADFVLEM
jgi:hypothetical protein